MKNKAQQGFLLVTAVIIISIIGIFGAAIVYMFTGSANASFKQLTSKQSFYIAESGLEYGLRQMIETGTSCSDIDTTHPNPIAFGQGEFQIQTTLYNPSPSATLSSAINDTTTTIPLSSTAGYSDTGGHVTIDNELIDYTSISGNSLIGARRGRDGTTAASHTAGTDVSQNQCNLTASGGVPTIAAGSTEKQLLADIQIPSPTAGQSGWFVGDYDASGESLYEWNNPADLDNWEKWGPSSSVTNTDYNGVDMVSPNDGWAVGDNGWIIHYDGTNWSNFQQVAKTLRSVYCNSASDCWAVTDGERIFHYNGTTWSQFTDVGTGYLYSVYCNDASDCWTGGVNGSGYGILHHYNGSNWNTSQQIAKTVRGVYCNSDSDCWAVTDGERIFHYNGSTWSEFSDVGTGTLRAVYCNSPSDCWAVGNNGSNQGVFYHYNGSSWSSGGSTDVILYSVACFAADDCWAGGHLGRIYHYDGSSWTLHTNYTGDRLYGVSLVTTPQPPSKVAWRVVTN